MAATRRTILELLGFGSAATVAIGTESFAGVAPERPGDIQTGQEAYSDEHFAQAFERMADAVRKRQLLIETIGVESEINHKVLTHTIKVTCAHMPEV